MKYTAKHASPETTTEEVAYDPYAKIVVNVHQPVYSGVTPLVLEAHEVTSLKNNDTLRQKRIAKLDAGIESVREYLVENYNDLELHADEIAALLDIELVKTVEVDVNVTFSTTIELEVGKDVDDISYFDFDFNIESSNSSFEISDFDSDVIYIRES
jgi:hypothetical protein